MRTPIALAFVMLAGAVAMPVAAAFPYPIFDYTCTPREDYVLIDYPLRRYANWCVGVEADAGPSTTVPYPIVGVGFTPTCVATVCQGAFCAPALGCFGGPPRPNVQLYPQPVTVPILTSVHGVVEATALCGSGNPCRASFSVGTSGPTLVLS